MDLQGQNSLPRQMKYIVRRMVFVRHCSVFAGCDPHEIGVAHVENGRDTFLSLDERQHIVGAKKCTTKSAKDTKSGIR